MTNEPRFLPLDGYREVDGDELRARATAFRRYMQRRRTVRHFSDRPVPLDAVLECVRAAATAPSGANVQPWHFVVVGDPAVKRRIREAAEAEEREFYASRAPREWLDALAPLGTDANKPFLETAPYLVAVFVERHGVAPDGRPLKHYYAHESAGIATGLLVAAIHAAGLVSLTHTPSPMKFLNEILGRPSNESPFVLIVVGYPAGDAVVPDIARKPLDAVCTVVE